MFAIGKHIACNLFAIGYHKDMKKIAYSKAALKTLVRMPANTARLIRSKIEQYAADPASLANTVITLKGMEGAKRLRVGDWRVVFSETGDVIAIIRIAPRGGVYDWKDRT